MTGGARSGKSAYALRQLESLDDVAFIATADCKDAEMQERIRRHQSRRPAAWKTIETSRVVVVALKTTRHEACILDCLTMLVANMLQDMLAKDPAAVREGRGRDTEALILENIELLLEGMRSNGAEFYIATNEVGSGAASGSQEERFFRDMLGLVNETAAAAADNVALMVCGLPLWVKGKAHSEPDRT
ncbi:MAG: bifunctional adenosylcobinamide kinase/adenosylcobinamide-phosphate guanylyltransferase [Clostridia bacterium]|nr:bifunctional adenosylcobinamide kinase/adenosylcobinamide-phosphate guanylyltransferase [Clostridia bacterium]